MDYQVDGEVKIGSTIRHSETLSGLRAAPSAGSCFKSRRVFQTSLLVFPSSCANTILSTRLLEAAKISSLILGEESAKFLVEPFDVFNTVPWTASPVAPYAWEWYA